MRDPRLAEVEFLSDLAKLEVRDVTWVVDRSAPPVYGLTDQQYRELILHFLLSGFVNGPADMVVSGRILGSPQLFRTIKDSLDSALMRDVTDFLSGRHCLLRISHPGRLRLWQLRDELLSKRKLDAFGILNDREFWERDLEITFAFLPKDSSVTVMIADLDNFKIVNDTLGHPVGDIVIKRYLQCVRDLTEKLGEAYRLGGDEVMAILPNLNQDRVTALAEALRYAVEATMKQMDELNESSPRPTVSIGAKSFVVREDSKKIYKVVDDLLAAAKRAGKNRVVIG